MVDLVSLTTKILLLVTLATTAHAQLAVNPKPEQRFVCVEKADAYKLALADMKGDAELKVVADKFVKDGRCRFMPATYLSTIDSYMDSNASPTRVVELMVYGELVWGIMGKFPDGVWLISH